MFNLGNRYTEKHSECIQQLKVLEGRILQRIVRDNDILLLHSLNTRCFVIYYNLIIKLLQLSHRSKSVYYTDILNAEDIFNQDDLTIIVSLLEINYTVPMHCIDRILEHIEDLSMRVRTHNELSQIIESIESKTAKQIRSEISSLSKRIDSDICAQNDLCNAMLTPDDFLERASYYATKYFAKLPTKITALDEMLNKGFSSGEIITIAAQPSVGKTAFTIDVFCKNIEEYFKPKKLKCLFISLDMGTHSIYYRLISRLCEMNYRNAVESIWSSTNEEEKLKIRNIISETPLYVTATNHINSIVETVRKYEQEIGLIIIDYIQLVRGDGEITRHESIGEYITAIRDSLVDSQAPIILISQLNRAYATRASRGSTYNSYSDLSDSSFLEKSSDVIIFLNRDEEREDAVIANVAKNRNGATGKVWMHFNKEHYKFSNMTQPDIHASKF